MFLNSLSCDPFVVLKVELANDDDFDFPKMISNGVKEPDAAFLHGEIDKYYAAVHKETEQRFGRLQTAIAKEEEATHGHSALTHAPMQLYNGSSSADSHRFSKSFTMAPILFIQKNFTLDLRPEAWPAPGLGGLLTVMSGTALVWLIPVSDILRNATSMKEYIATDHATKEIADDTCFYYTLMPKSAVWVPFGWDAVVIGVSGSAQEQPNEDPSAEYSSIQF